MNSIGPAGVSGFAHRKILFYYLVVYENFLLKGVAFFGRNYKYEYPQPSHCTKTQSTPRIKIAILTVR